MFHQLQQYLPFTVLKLCSDNFIETDVVGCNSTYRLRYWNKRLMSWIWIHILELQQYLPFTVLKHAICITKPLVVVIRQLQQYLPFTVLKLSHVNWPPLTRSVLVATVLTVYGIETCELPFFLHDNWGMVATVLTVYGIETKREGVYVSSFKLQQYLPFTVLKPSDCRSESR